MKALQRQVGMIFLLALFISVSVSYAQDDAGITVVGSGVVQPILNSLAEASGVETARSTTVTGTNAGFEQFCQGQADVTTAARPISTQEDANCATNGVRYAELLLAHNIAALIARPDAAYPQCLTTADLNTIFPPSVQGQTTNWNQVGTGGPDLPLTVVVPPADSLTFVVLDNLIQGDAVRADAVTAASDEDVIAAVSQDAGAIGVVNFASALAASDRVKMLELNTNEVVGCAVPSVENVESRSYAASEQLFVYVNRASLEKAGLKDLLSFAVGQEAVPVLEELGLTAPSATAQAANQATLEGTGGDRPFSGGTTTYEIPFDVSGAVTIGGAAVANEYLSTVTGGFQSIYQGVTFDTRLEGQPAGVRRLCNGEIDIAVVESDLTDEQLQNCQANNITTLPVELGRQAVVLVGNASTPHLECLTGEQLAKVWSASENPPANWNQVDASFPDQPMTLFAPEAGDAATDLLLTRTAGAAVPARTDANLDNDPLYRAAATANVEGALAYMSWGDYQRVLANNQADIQLVGVDTGSGCVAPDETTIADGTYPLTRAARLLVIQASLSKPAVQSVLWYIASDENFGLLTGSGLYGVSFGSLPDLRETLQTAYAQAAQVSAEATPEPGAEATAEATPAADATPEATPSS